MIALVGYTGFVGSNIYTEGKEAITGLYNSQNIESAYRQCVTDSDIVDCKVVR